MATLKIGTGKDKFATAVLKKIGGDKAKRAAARNRKKPIDPSAPKETRGMKPIPYVGGSFTPMEPAPGLRMLISMTTHAPITAVWLTAAERKETLELLHKIRTSVRALNSDLPAAVESAIKKMEG